MKKKILSTLGASILACALSTTASQAFVLVYPGATSGLAVGAPLPEGLFAVDSEFYGQRDGNPGHLGLNLPVLTWSTPVTFYNTRLEVLALTPVFHNDSFKYGGGQPGSGGIAPNGITDGVARPYNPFAGIILAHDFGNSLGASFTGLIAPPSQAFITHTFTALSFAVSYTGNGFDLTANLTYAGTFGSNNSFNTTANPPLPGYPAGTLPGISDALDLDLTATKKFDKVEIGFVGYAHTDIEDGIDNSNAILTAITAKNFGTTGFTRAGAVAVGGLVGYDFGRFSMQGVVTREIAVRGSPELLWGTGKETRGMLRLILPLYVAPAAPAPVVAKY